MISCLSLKHVDMQGKQVSSRVEVSPWMKKATLDILLREFLPVSLNQEKC